ncbi:MAG: crotonase/enoyl-CoA hydratase family protein [Reyranella sp.]|uniref:crotonase/enoyl-CoA hydratase family protein n=1 Tax=Reyranella sp. TaxID=1929291 RepID=UPI00121B332F|nr:crotonase/enoyl-CoA hydratase family protein [Reyranella sp.]TAJ95626.1 MAG: crotonase/enoyl-CoA hydratase family protein [Reyranella sp.]TBR30429.1 MAG: crotonase/enoyl-CoA hydratase family protein [Reyranella sp.]
MAKVAVEREGATTIVSIDRFAEARNAVDPETAILLREAFLAFDADDSQSVAILTGRGGSFCAGFDLKVAASREGVSEHDPAGPGPMGPTRHLLSKPVIAAIEGHAVAGGLELALWCDLRVASESAKFGVFCRRWGVPLIDGGTVRLPRLIGHSRALDMILTGREVSAREAFEWGLANRLVPEGRALAEAKVLAGILARFPQTCLRSDRRSSYDQWSLDVPAALVNEARHGMPALQAESRKGAARFAAGKGRGGDFGEI